MGQGGDRQSGQPGQRGYGNDNGRGQPGARDQGGYRQYGYSAMNDGSLQGPWGPLPAEGQRGLETAYREGLRDLSQLRQSLAQDNAETAQEIQDLIRQMQQLDPSRFPGNPLLIERIRAQVLPNLEQLEIRLRRQLEEKNGGQVRATSPDSIPAGYADAVAEYFRKLSQGK